MNEFWRIVVSNGSIVAAMALAVGLLGRVWKNPQGMHFLWLCVLAKLFLPPIVTIPIALPAASAALTPETPDRGTGQRFGSAERSVYDSGASPSGQASARPEETDLEPAALLDGRAASIGWFEDVSWPSLFAWTWGVGSVGLALVYSRALFRFQSLLRYAKPAPTTISAMAAVIGPQLGLRRIPEIVTLSVRVSPLVWAIGGRPRIVLPTELCRRLDGARLRTILVHEMAHIRRKDHVVRLLDLLALVVFWWHPATWFAVRQLRELEEECCDSVVLGTVPFGMKAYTTAILDTLDFLAEGPATVPLAATTVRPSVSLARRIKMLHGQSPAQRLRLGHLLMLAAPLAFPMAIAVAAAPGDSAGVSDGVQTERAKAILAEAPLSKNGQPAVAAAAEKITFKDPSGDDDGPGTYTYPTDPVYTPGSFDLTEFSVTKQGDRVKFDVTVKAPLADPWKMRTGFSVQMVFIFIQTDNHRGPDFTDTVPGLNVTFAPPDAWDKLVILSPQPAARVEAEIEQSVPKAEQASIIVPDRAKAKDHTICATVDLAALGGGDPRKWGYQVVMQSNEGYPTDSDLLTRKVNAVEEQHRFGGGINSDCNPNLMDILAGKAEGADSEVPAQHDMLQYACNPDGSIKQEAVLKMVRK